MLSIPHRGPESNDPLISNNNNEKSGGGITQKGGHISER